MHVQSFQLLLIMLMVVSHGQWPIQERKKGIDVFEVWCYRRLLRIIIDRQKDKLLRSEQDRHRGQSNHQEIHFGENVRLFWPNWRKDDGEEDIKRHHGQMMGRLYSHLVYGATNLASGRRRWCALVTTTSAQLCAIWTIKERERERERELHQPDITILLNVKLFRKPNCY